MAEFDKYYQQLRDFHRLMDGRVPERPEVFTLDQALNRSDFKLEEIVELVYATAESDRAFQDGIDHLHRAIDKAAAKTQSKEHKEASMLVGQVDALIDLLYFTYGSFALMGVDPDPIFDLVHKANMGKIWPDGKAHHHPITGKVLKPDHWERDFAPEAKIKQELDRQLGYATNPD